MTWRTVHIVMIMPAISSVVFWKLSQRPKRTLVPFVKIWKNLERSSKS